MGFFEGKTVLVTGGTGSFGKRFVRTMLERHRARRVIVFSRDELKQFEMQQDPRFDHHPSLRYFLGDVRDPARLHRAFEAVDYVIHAAALKQVPAAEYNPFEAVKTNILGAQNIIDAAIDAGVERVVALSTDKAACPVNLYGATKLCSDKLFVAGNFYAGGARTSFSVVRYGNVLGSRGSVIPLFLSRRHTGVLPVTDERMTRFWITLQQGADFVLKCLEDMVGGELFVPKIPSMRMVDVARTIAPAARLEHKGIRPGEKLHEVMVPEDDARHTVALEDRYLILPSEPWPRHQKWLKRGTRCAEDFRYASDSNDWWLTPSELRAMIAQLELPEAEAYTREREAA
jgi:UDP-N-acetylglucosamine 4,6-dehydratase/5-epimerase